MPITRAERGFTLFELLAVLVLVAIAASVLSMGLSRGMESARERDMLASLVAGLEQARTRAILTQRPIRARFDLDARTLEVPGRDAVRWPASFAVTVHTARDLGSEFEFYPVGAASGGHVLLTHGARRFRIDIAWLTGRVTLTALGS